MNNYPPIMDVVYPLFNGSKHRDDFELRFSLRSMSNQPWVRNMYLVGYKPQWVKNVIHIECDDPYGRVKDANIINKIIRACFDKELSDNFVINSDDQFILKPIPAETIGPYMENPKAFNEAKMKYAKSAWHQRILDTIRYARSRNLPDYIIDSHIPYVVNKKEYIETMLNIGWGRQNGFTTHAYFNLNPHIKVEKYQLGLSIRITMALGDNDIKARLEKAIFLNNNDNGLSPALKRYLQNKFPKPSKWE